MSNTPDTDKRQQPQAEQSIQELREALARLERELVVLRADFERLRVETQQQLGAKLT